MQGCFHSLVWAILRSNPPSLHVGCFFKIYPSDALGVYFPIYTPQSVYRSVYLIKHLKPVNASLSQGSTREELELVVSLQSEEIFSDHRLINLKIINIRKVSQYLNLNTASVYIAAILLGFGGPVLWTAQVVFIFFLKSLISY